MKKEWGVFCIGEGPATGGSFGFEIHKVDRKIQKTFIVGPSFV
jgi:hypothetical protein